MAENIILKARVEKMEMASPITASSGVTSATWEELPLTLRDDMVSIIESEPEESEVYSHENDAAEDYDIAGTGMKMTGSFIKADYDQLVTLMGGAKEGAVGSEKYAKSAKTLLLNKAFRLTLRGGGTIVIPNAKGAVRAELNVGYGGVSKFPFSFKLMKASDTWDCVIQW
jgi:hypothetical protein